MPRSLNHKINCKIQKYRLHRNPEMYCRRSPTGIRNTGVKKCIGCPMATVDTKYGTTPYFSIKQLKGLKT